MAREGHQRLWHGVTVVNKLPLEANDCPGPGACSFMGTDGVRFYTEQKNVTAHWFSEEEAREAKVLNGWDGMISMPGR